MSSESRRNMTGGRVGPAAVGSQHERDIDLQQLIGQLACQPVRGRHRCNTGIQEMYVDCQCIF